MERSESDLARACQVVRQRTYGRIFRSWYVCASGTEFEKGDNEEKSGSVMNVRRMDRACLELHVGGKSKELGFNMAARVQGL